MVRQYPVSRPVDCLNSFAGLNSLTIAGHCLGVDPHASRQLRTNTTPSFTVQPMVFRSKRPLSSSLPKHGRIRLSSVIWLVMSIT